MIRKQILTLGLVMLLFSAGTLPVWALDTVFSSNYVVPESQSGFEQEQYEVKAAQKLQRGAENFFLSPLEIPHGIKEAKAQRESEFLPFSLESFFIGTFRGIGRGFQRFGVGFYEMVTCIFPQPPILDEMDEWLY